jgi:hypothetical protein
MQQGYTQDSMQQLVGAAKAGTALQLLLPQAADSGSPAAPAAAAATTSGTATCSSDLNYSSSSRAAASPAAAAAEAAKRAAAGPFAVLGRDTLLEVLCCLDHGSVAALGQTCRSLHEAVEDGTVWQVMMTKAFPRHQLKPSNMTGGRVGALARVWLCREAWGRVVAHDAAAPSNMAGAWVQQMVPALVRCVVMVRRVRVSQV